MMLKIWSRQVDFFLFSSMVQYNCTPFFFLTVWYSTIVHHFFLFNGTACLWKVDDVETMERVDWTTLQIMETHDDGQIELMSESQMCELLGIEDESAPNTIIPTNDE